MNQHTLTRTEAATLSRLISYGRGTASNMARALDLDRRTCQRLTTPEGLADIVAMIDPRKLDLREWYALLYTRYHSTGDKYRLENCTARQLREDLAIVAVEMIGGVMLERMVEDWAKVKGKGGVSVHTFRKSLERDMRSIHMEVERYYHYPEPSPASFTDAHGDPL